MSTSQCSVSDGLAALHKYALATRDAALLAYPAVRVAPVIREPVPQYRAGRRDELLKVAKDLQAQHDLLDEIQQALSACQAAVRTYRVSVNQALAPVSGLPVEILREIFLWADCTYKESSKFRRVDLATSISHVCSYWRGVACSTREFWQNIQVTPMDSADAVEAWTSRGRMGHPDVDFAVTLVPAQIPDGSSISPPLLASLDHTGRFTSKFVHDVEVDIFFSHLRLWKAWPTLRRLTHLTVESIETHSYSSCDPIDLFVTPFPELQHLELVSFVFAYSQRPETEPVVQTLICRRCEIACIFWEDFDDLKELRLIDCTCGDLLDEFPGELYYVLKLSTLVVHDCDRELVMVLFKTTCAHLDTLDISLQQEDDQNVFNEIFRCFFDEHVSSQDAIKYSDMCRLTATQLEVSAYTMRTLRMKGTMQHILSAVKFFGQDDGWALPYCLKHLELLVIGYEDGTMHTTIARHIATYCLDLITGTDSTIRRLEVLKASPCLLNSDHLQKYADIGVRVEAVR